MGETVIQCLFCATGREAEVVRAVQERTDHRALFPQKLKPLWVNGRWEETDMPLFPGYVFTYGDRALTWADLRGERRVLRILGYGDGTAQGSALTGRDRAFGEWLWAHDGRVGALEAVETGDRVRITDGLLRAYSGKVRRVDKRKRLVQVELELLGENRSVWLAYAVVAKEDAPAQTG